MRLLASAVQVSDDFSQVPQLVVSDMPSKIYMQCDVF